MSDIRQTYSIEPKPDVEIPEDWADVLRPFKGVRLDEGSTRITCPVGYFEATDEAIGKIRTFLEAMYRIEQI